MTYIHDVPPNDIYSWCTSKWPLFMMYLQITSIHVVPLNVPLLMMYL